MSVSASSGGAGQARVPRTLSQRSAVALVVPDTGVLIELFRDAAALTIKDRNRWRFRISAVVHSELLCGARGSSEKRFVDALARGFPPVAPSAGQWASCGKVLAQLHRDRQFDGRGMQLLQNDVLVAITARDLGLPLVTTNPSDFDLIVPYAGGLKILPF
jgi:predicted nucleic acid-binding protein